MDNRVNAERQDSAMIRKEHRKWNRESHLYCILSGFVFNITCIITDSWVMGIEMIMRLIETILMRRGKQKNLMESQEI